MTPEWVPFTTPHCSLRLVKSSWLLLLCRWAGVKILPWNVGRGCSFSLSSASPDRTQSPQGTPKVPLLPTILPSDSAAKIGSSLAFWPLPRSQPNRPQSITWHLHQISSATMWTTILTANRPWLLSSSLPLNTKIIPDYLLYAEPCGSHQDTTTNKSRHGACRGTHGLVEEEGYQSHSHSQICGEISLHSGVTGMKMRFRVLLGELGLVQGDFSGEGTFELKPVGWGNGGSEQAEYSRQREERSWVSKRNRSPWWWRVLNKEEGPMVRLEKKMEASLGKALSPAREGWWEQWRYTRMDSRCSLEIQ